MEKLNEYEIYNEDAVYEEICFKRHDDDLLQRLVDTALDNINRKIDTEILMIEGELLYYDKNKVKEIIINEIYNKNE